MWSSDQWNHTLSVLYFPSPFHSTLYLYDSSMCGIYLELISIVKCSSIEGLYHSLFIHSNIPGQLGCFQFGALTENNIWIFLSMYLSVHKYVSFFPFFKPSNKGAGICILVLQFSCSVMSNSLRPHGLQHTRLPCLSPTCSNSYIKLIKLFESDRSPISSVWDFFCASPC